MADTLTFTGIAFARIPIRLLDDPSMSDRAVRLYGVLISYCRRTAVAWPGRAELARRLGCSDSSVKRALGELGDAGWITRVERPGTSNQYHLHDGSPVTGGGSPVDHPPGSHVNHLPGSPVDHKVDESEVDESEVDNSAVPAPVNHWDALVSVFGQPTNGTRSLYGRMVRDLAAWHPSEIPRRAAALALEWGPSRLTPASLEKHWSRYEPGKPGSLTEDDLWEARQRQKAEAAARLELE